MLWDLAGAGQPRRLEGHEAAVAAVAMFPDGRHAVSGSDDGTVGYWDLATASPIARWRGHQGKVAAVAVMPDGSLVASGGWDRGLRLWDPPTGDSRLLDGHAAAINAIAIVPGESPCFISTSTSWSAPLERANHIKSSCRCCASTFP